MESKRRAGTQVGAPGEQKAAVNADPARLGELNSVLRAARCSAGFPV